MYLLPAAECQLKPCCRVVPGLAYMVCNLIPQFLCVVIAGSIKNEEQKSVQFPPPTSTLKWQRLLEFCSQEHPLLLWLQAQVSRSTCPLKNKENC